MASQMLRDGFYKYVRLNTDVYLIVGRLDGISHQELYENFRTAFGENQNIPVAVSAGKFIVDGGVVYQIAAGSDTLEMIYDTADGPFIAKFFKLEYGGMTK